MSLLLASASQEVKVWDVKENSCELSLKSASELFPTSINSISWNHTNQVVAVAFSVPKKISLLQTSNLDLLSYLPFSEKGPQNPVYESQVTQSVCFSNTSRYLACGVGGIVHLWDLKRQALRYDSGVSGTVKGKINVVNFLTEANDMISGDSFGYVRLWNTSKASSDNSSLDLLYKEGIGVSCTHIPNLGASKFASGYADGSLILWDPNNTSPLRTQSIHRDTLTALAFSPKNSRLVATVGLDGNLCLVDTASKSTGSSVLSASVQVGDPLHCMSFHEDAIHTAVGTSNGQILIYDWRNVKRPLQRLNAHGSAVNELKFQVFASAIKKADQSSTIESPEPVPYPPPRPDMKRGISVKEERGVTSATVQLDPTIEKNKPSQSTGTPQQPSSKLVDSTFSKINEVFSVTPTKELRAEEASYKKNIINDEVTSRLTSVEPGLLPGSYNNKGANSPRRSSLSNNTSITSSTFESISSEPVEEPKPVSSKLSRRESLSLVTKARLPTSPFEESARTTPPMNSSPLQDNPMHKSVKRDSLLSSNPYQENPMVNKPAKKETMASSSSPFQDNPMITTKRDSLTPGKMKKRDSSYDIDGFEDNPMHNPPEEPLSYSRSSSITDSIAGSLVTRSTKKSSRKHENYSTSEEKEYADALAIVEHSGRSPKGNPQFSQDFAKIYGRGLRDDFSSLKKAIRPVTNDELENALQLLKYDIHKDMKVVIKEVIRQFDISRNDTSSEIRKLSKKLNEVMEANQELRKENERLRRIY